MSVGETLDLLIRQRGLTYSEIGRAIGRASQLVAYDVKKVDLNTSVVRQYTEFFEITMSDFFYIAEGNVRTTAVDDVLNEVSELSERLVTLQKHLRFERVRSVQGRHRMASLKTEDGVEVCEC